MDAVGTDNSKARMRALENSKIDKHSVTVIGAGAFGTAMAVICARNGHPVKMYARDQAQCEAINRVHANPKYLSEFTLPDIITATSSLTVLPFLDTGVAPSAMASLTAQEALDGATVVFLALPCQVYTSQTV